MQTVNNVVRWSFLISGVSGFMLLSVAAVSWLLVEILVVLVGITA